MTPLDALSAAGIVAHDARVQPRPGACSFDECNSAVEARGWCAYHYMRWWKTGSPVPPQSLTRAELFWRHVDKVETGCWIWTGALTPGGYGQFRFNNQRTGVAHRFAYELLVGPIPEGLDLDHLCRNRPCVRPDHLEPVTNRENALRGVGIPATNAAKTHCKRGHPLSGDNVRIETTGSRRCKACVRETWAARRGAR